MRVLRDISGKASGLAARLALSLTPGTGDRNAAADRLTSRVVTAGLIALPVVPAALCLVTSPAVALPAGLGGTTAVTLVLASLAAWRADAQAADIAQPAEPRSGDADAAAFDLMPGLVTLHDGRGQVVAVHGRDRDRLIEGLRPLNGQGLVDQIHVSDRIAFLQAVDRLRQGARGAEVTVRLSTLAAGHEDGAQFLHRKLHLSRFAGETAELSGFLVQMLDNSAEESLKEQLAERTADAHSANEAKSRFLAAVSHELRTPLNAILGFSDILSGEYFGKLENDRQREYVSLINQSGNHLLAVVNTMLDMSKIEAGHYELICEPFAVAEVVQACEAMLSLQAKTKGVTLTSRIAKGVGEVVADRRAVQQILINLVGNAVKFTDAGGVVSVDAEVRDNALKLSICDTGIGIPADKIALLGKPFMQVQNEYSRKYEGTGLGLSLVKGLVELHGGEFAASSVLGEGTVITVTLPADGSGASSNQSADTGATQEFPPRLAAPAKMTKNDRGQRHEYAKSQIA